MSSEWPSSFTAHLWRLPQPLSLFSRIFFPFSVVLNATSSSFSSSAASCLPACAAKYFLFFRPSYCGPIYPEYWLRAHMTLSPTLDIPFVAHRPWSHLMVHVLYACLSAHVLYACLLACLASPPVCRIRKPCLPAKTTIHIWKICAATNGLNESEWGLGSSKWLLRKTNGYTAAEGEAFRSFPRPHLTNAPSHQQPVRESTGEPISIR